MYDSLKQMELKGKSGLDKIMEIFQSYYVFYKENEEKFRIIYDIGNVRKQSQSPKIEEFLKIDQLMFTNFAKLIVEGQNDGSIATSMDAKTLTTSLIFLFTGFLNQLTITGANFAKHLDITVDDIAENVLKLVKSALK